MIVVPARRVGEVSGDSPAELSDDATTVGFLVGVELAVASVYAEGSRLLSSPAAVAAAAAFRAHHLAHAAALSGGVPGPGPNKALLANLAASIEVLTDEEGELALLYSLEEQLAASYHWVIGRLTTVSALQQAAAILTVEAQHAVTVGTLLAKPVDVIVPSFQTDTGYLIPADFGAAGVG